MSAGTLYLRSTSLAFRLALSAASAALALTGCAKGDDGIDEPEGDAGPDAYVEPDAPGPDARQEAKSFEVTLDPPLAIPEFTPTGTGVNVALVSKDVEYATGVDIEVDVTHTYRGDLRVELLRGPENAARSLKILKEPDPRDSADDLKVTFAVGTLELGTPLNDTYQVRFIDTANISTGVINRVKMTFKVD